MIVSGSRLLAFRLAAPFRLARVSAKRPLAVRLRPDDDLALRDCARDPRFDAAIAAGQAALHDGPIQFDQLALDPLVLPAFREFGLHGFADAAPLRNREAGDGGQPRVVGRQRVVLPIVHDQQQIGAVLKRVEIAGVAQVVPDIERHPGAAHAASSKSLARMYAPRSRRDGSAARRGSLSLLSDRYAM